MDIEHALLAHHRSLATPVLTEWLSLVGEETVTNLVARGEGDRIGDWVCQSGMRKATRTFLKRNQASVQQQRFILQVDSSAQTLALLCEQKLAEDVLDLLVEDRRTSVRMALISNHGHNGLGERYSHLLVERVLEISNEERALEVAMTLSENHAREMGVQAVWNLCTQPGTAYSAVRTWPGWHELWDKACKDPDVVAYAAAYGPAELERKASALLGTKVEQDWSDPHTALEAFLNGATDGEDILDWIGELENNPPGADFLINELLEAAIAGCGQDDPVLVIGDVVSVMVESSLTRELIEGLDRSALMDTWYAQDGALRLLYQDASTVENLVDLARKHPDMSCLRASILSSTWAEKNPGKIPVNMIADNPAHPAWAELLAGVPAPVARRALQAWTPTWTGTLEELVAACQETNA